MNTTPHPTHLDPCPPGWIPAAAAPARFVTSRGGTYVHIPRSLALGGDRGGVVRHWCGSSSAVSEVVWTDDPDQLAEPRPLCGTCFGRDLGYDADFAAVAFRPTLTLNDLSRRRWCPSSLVVPTGRDLGRYGEHRCLLCGHHGTVHARRGWNAWGVAFERHHPATTTALVWCPTCGIKHLRLHGDHVVCESWRCNWSTPIAEVPS